MPRSKPQPPTPTAADDDELEAFIRAGLTRAWDAALQHATDYVSTKTGMSPVHSQEFVTKAMSANE